MMLRCHGLLYTLWISGPSLYSWGICVSSGCDCNNLLDIPNQSNVCIHPFYQWNSKGTAAAGIITSIRIFSVCSVIYMFNTSIIVHHSFTRPTDGLHCPRSRVLSIRKEGHGYNHRIIDHDVRCGGNDPHRVIYIASVHGAGVPWQQMVYRSGRFL